jgi:hypothetical protein
MGGLVDVHYDEFKLFDAIFGNKNILLDAGVLARKLSIFCGK